MSKHEHGKMDINSQKKTFAGFMTFWIWLIGFSVFALIVMAVFNS